jgi:hypothetical protein
MNTNNVISVPVPNPSWADERKWCKYARRDDIEGASQCPMLCSRPNQRPYCRLNGSRARSLCVFDEPDDSIIWQEINKSVAEYKANGWA